MKPKFYQTRWWRMSLLAAALAIVLVSVWFTNNIAQELKTEEHKRVELWAAAQKALMDEQAAEFCDLTLPSEILTSNKTIPVILTDSDLRVIDALNYEGKDIQKDADFFKQEVATLKENGRVILIETPLYKNYIFYQNSLLVSSLEWFPYIQFGILAVFLGLGFLTWSASQQAEQERVWVGMAKETAHQLGTPISSLIGWMENIKATYEDDEYLEMVVEEIHKDIRLLGIVAERFSKMGASPELRPTNVLENLHRYHQYIKQRASKKIVFDFPNPDEHAPILVNINSLLFDWVIENLLKNALDAMEGTGKISIRIEQDDTFVYIDFMDTGKGVPKNLYKKIFQPGFSTKKRGWGLGLSLCKRIIETYHKGKIFVKYAVVGEGTIFRVQLPLLPPDTPMSLPTDKTKS